MQDRQFRPEKAATISVTTSVMPAQAGIQTYPSGASRCGHWIPAPRLRGDKLRGNDDGRGGGDVHPQILPRDLKNLMHDVKEDDR